MTGGRGEPKPGEGSDVDMDSFRAGLRVWLRDNLPAQAPPNFYTPERRDFDSRWQATLWGGGYGALNWPEQFGGMPVTVEQLVAFHEEMAQADAPEHGCLFIALSHAGPTLVAHGTEAQQERHIPRILAGEEVWCQGFSEPEAGSDLAAISTRGEMRPDHIVVSGRKIWTSYGPLADYCELLVRTDSDSSRHAGLTWMILDMRSEGVQVRPIKTLTGNPRFSELVLDEVKVPVENVVGGVGNGWKVAMSTLGFERGSAMVGRQVRTERRIDRLRELAESRGLGRDRAVGATLEQFSRECLAMKAMVRLSLDPEESVAHDGSMLRVFHSELVGRMTRFAMAELGISVLDGSDWTVDYLDELRSKVTAGTLDIQRNIIGERHLGLPR